MIKDFIGKKVEVVVSFATGYYGSCPTTYDGVLLSVDDSFVKIEITKSKGKKFKKSNVATVSNGKMIINKQYIISILEVE